MLSRFNSYVWMLDNQFKFTVLVFTKFHKLKDKNSQYILEIQASSEEKPFSYI